MFDICEARSFSCENKKASSPLVDLAFVFRDKSHNTICILLFGKSDSEPIKM